MLANADIFRNLLGALIDSGTNRRTLRPFPRDSVRVQPLVTRLAKRFASAAPCGELIDKASLAPREALIGALLPLGLGCGQWLLYDGVHRCS